MNRDLSRAEQYCRHMSALCGASGSHNGMEFINKQDNLPITPLNILKDRL